MEGGSLKEENARLSSEIEELRLRLDEAEQALEAIRTGQVESLVMEGPDGPRIYSLEGADHAYRVVVEAMNEGAATIAEDGTILYCNSRFAEMLDAPLEGVMGSLVYRFLPAHSRLAFGAMIREASGSDSRGELELLGQGGQVVPAHVSVAVIRDGESRRFCLVAADLRAQKRSEEIVASERLARSVIEQAAEAIIVCDDQGRVIRASSAAAELCGSNPLLRPFDEVFALEVSASAGRHSNLREFDASSVARAVLCGGNASAAPGTLRRPDGSTANVLISATALRGTSDRVLGCVINLVDVSESVRVQEALRESEAKYRHLFEAIEGMVTVYYVERDDGGHIIERRLREANRTLLRTVGASSIDEIRGRTSSEVFGKVWSDEVLPAVQKALETGQVQVQEVYRPESGRHYLTSVVPLDADTYLGTGWDITEIKRAEEALREADRNKNHFLAMLSHELRNPLTPIRNSLYILDRAAPGGEQARRAQAVIGRQIDHMARLVDDLLDVTRLSRGKIQLQREIADLRELVRGTVEDIRPSFDAAGVALEVGLPDRSLLVHADRTRLAQIVGNLLNNASKFTPRGGRTSVCLEHDGTNNTAVIRVRDDGAGMSEEMLSRLFQPFSQADNTLDRSHGGLGLGLSLVKGLAEMHGGTVSAKSDGPNKGAELIVRLPLEGASVGQAPLIGSRPAEQSRRVLIIEDNEDAAESLKEVLELESHVVVIAHSGPAGLEVARRFAPEVVLCDIGLPGMDGYEVARAFRGDPELRSAFLVAVSGYAGPADLVAARAAGFDQHVAKPPSIAEVEELIRTAGKGL